MLKILTDNSLLLIEKPIQIYKTEIKGAIIKKYNLIIEDDNRHKFFILSSDCLDTIDRAYEELCNKIIYRDNNIKTDLFFNFTNYK
ncbi:hypothetical protein R4J09_14130 [Brachyspira intermedia]|uniref:hypothetical protein n=1 Tax=Brachyspira intermedia TaxID=84377 RepID=UPI0030046843